MGSAVSQAGGLEMDEDGVWAAIDDQRRRTAELLESLTREEWARPSLCAGWTVRDVAAHLTLQQIGLAQGVRLALAHPRGVLDVNRMIHDSSVAKAAAPTEQLIQEIRAMIGSRRHNVGMTARETLIDILVHSQDIAIPVGRALQLDPQASVLAADRVWSSMGTRKAKVFDAVPMSGYRLRATDAAWTVGEGSEVRGPAGALLLLLTGRRAGLEALDGPGAELLRREVGAA